jgi:poly(hydroxyalkanoate) depolymerase family esterase
MILQEKWMLPSFKKANVNTKENKNYSSIKTLKNKLSFGKKVLAFLTLALLNLNGFSQALTPVTSFGSNPGNLRMYSYVPTSVSGPVSLVVVLHGCTQTATSYAEGSGWNKLADKHKFILVYPEQKKENNSYLCFNWFDSLYQQKGQLQVLSIKQMVDYMKANYSIDTTKIFVTGLSAGGAMSNVMLANYPETFKKGAIMSGVPYRASKDTLSSYYATHGFVTKTPDQWGKLVKNANPSYAGEYPHVAIFQGGLDSTVYVKTAVESIKQWTNVNGADQTPESVDTAFQGNTGVSLSIYNDTITNKPVVYYYKIKKMKHALAVDTGSCARQGGKVQAYVKDVDFHSTYWAADYFGIINAPYTITGLPIVFQNANNITYSVSNTTGSTYQWTVPAGATIVSGQGTNSITVNFGTASGNVSVIETTSGGCVNDLATKYVKVLDFSVIVNQTGLINCYGAKTAQLAAVVTGNNGPFTVSWAPVAQTTPVISNLGVGSYTLTVKDKSNTVINTTTINVTQPALLVTTQSQTICAGETLKIGSTKHRKSGLFTDVLTSSKGCDSVVKTLLVVLPEIFTTQIVKKCAGESITVGTNTYTANGSYTDVLKAANGCDSTVHTVLIIANQLNANAGGNNNNNNSGWFNGASNFAGSNNAKQPIMTSSKACPTNNNGEKSGTVDIFPNPFSTFSTIKFSNTQTNVTIKVVDVNGNVILSTTFTGTEFQLEAETLKKGNYSVLIIDTNGKVTTKNIIVK